MFASGVATLCFVWWKLWRDMRRSVWINPLHGHSLRAHFPHISCCRSVHACPRTDCVTCRRPDQTAFGSCVQKHVSRTCLLWTPSIRVIHKMVSQQFSVVSDVDVVVFSMGKHTIGMNKLRNSCNEEPSNPFRTIATIASNVLRENQRFL